jgi:hypothetical protein
MSKLGGKFNAGMKDMRGEVCYRTPVAPELLLDATRSPTIDLN